jgi:hypothetical protein
MSRFTRQVPLATIRMLQQSLSDARDEQLTRVVGMIDDLVERASVDALLAPLRARLAGLRVPRKPSFCRLLFTPLDTVIVAPTEWRRGMAAVPRSALKPLADAAWAGLGHRHASLTALLNDTALPPSAILRRAGEIAWPAAAPVLEQGQMPPAWTAQTGLNAADHASISRSVATVLRAACGIEALVDAAASGLAPDPRNLVASLTSADGAGPDGMALLLAVLLHRLPPDATLPQLATQVAAAQSDVAGRAALDNACDFLLGGFDPEAIEQRGLRAAADQIERVASLLEGFDAPGPAHRPSRRGQAEQLRRTMDRACRRRFAAELRDRVLGPAVALTAQTTQAEVAALEQAARELRALVNAGERVGAPEHYDAALRSAMAKLSAAPAPLPDRARLVEILLGPDAALAALGGLELATTRDTV